MERSDPVAPTQRGQMPGARYAMNIVHPRSPVLRVRYRGGILVDPYGFPDWLLYARAQVDLPDPPAELGIDEIRVLDVLAANMVMADDPLWRDSTGTPAGWCWAHIGLTRRLALVPAELHAAHRHGGGVRTLHGAGSHRGLWDDSPGVRVGTGPGDEVPDELLDGLERLLEYALPASYRQYLAETNGAAPAQPAVLPGFGFIADQPLFGLARVDQHQDLAFVREWLTDRFTPDLLPIGYVQGGILTIAVSGPDAGSVWYWDDDDARDLAAYGPVEIRDRLLHRCADTFDDFRRALVRPPRILEDRAEAWILIDRVLEIRDELAGTGLPPLLQAPWQAPPPRVRDQVSALFELT
jgi:A nuclease of the HNH/ENDO VII superfamily with conserved WHH/SMI1 / KNR4 family (SUKH-1)